MASGILVPNAINLGFAISTKLIVSAESSGIASASDLVKGLGTGPWSPPQWAKPALTIMMVPVAIDPNNYQAGTATRATTINYVFDAVLRAQHRRTVRKTQHPVLTGASISDHAYNEASRLVLDILMSDAMQAYPANGAWAGAATKSVSAWQVLKKLEQNHTLLTIQTRLDTYENMLITDCSAPDDQKTLHGLRATVTFEEVLTAGILSVEASSARPQTSNVNPGGIVQSLPPDPTQASQHVVTDSTNVLGAGYVSSNALTTVGP